MLCGDSIKAYYKIFILNYIFVIRPYFERLVVAKPHALQMLICLMVMNPTHLK